MLFKLYKLTPVGRSLLLALLAMGLANCQSSPDGPSGDDDQHDDDDDDDDDHDQGTSALQPLKLDLVGLVAGEYAETCIKFVGDEFGQVGSGSPFTISATTGQASWGFGDIDMVHTPSQDFGVVVGDGLAASRFDLLDPVSQDRLAIIGVTVTRDGYAAATVTDDRPSPSLGDGCAAATTPALAGADLWQLMNDYIVVPTTKLHCIDVSTAAQFDWDFSFSASSIVLGALVTRPADPRASEQIQLTELEPSKGFIYTLTRADRQTLLVSMTPERKLDTVELISADATLIGCSLP